MDAELHGESIDDLREKLKDMRRLIAERQTAGSAPEGRSSIGYVIDGSFLSAVFGAALVVIITVSVYAFYNLYHAILKKFPSHHTEL